MKIAAFEGFYGGSHRKWLDGFVEHTKHEVRIFGLPDRFWKWRMHGGAITLARQFNASDFDPDYLLVTDMIDLNVLLSLTRKRTANVPVVFYFHENQINYPWSEIDRDVKYDRNHHYGFINYASALSADIVLFNSDYHKEAFIGALPRFLKMFPDYQNAITVSEIESKSRVLHIGVNLKAYDVFSGQGDKRKNVVPPVESLGSESTSIDRGRGESTIDPSGKVPVILWNHRWEFDKNPAAFFDAMLELHKRGLAFNLIVCGESTEMYPEVFDQIKESLKDHIVHWGYADSFEEYARLLFSSDIMPVTSNQDFFGISAVEAMYCDVYPLLPDRLAFPEHIPEEFRSDHLYSSNENLVLRLAGLLENGVPTVECASWVKRYDWSEMIGEYDELF